MNNGFQASFFGGYVPFTSLKQTHSKGHQSFVRRHAIWIVKHVDKFDQRVINLVDAVGFENIPEYNI